MSPNFRFLFVALFGALLLSGCVKDDPEAYFIKLLVEGYTPGNNSKAIVGDAAHGDAMVTYWADGDSLWINGYWYEVDVSGSDAVARGVHIEEANTIYRAVYPKSAHNGGISGDVVTIKVPNRYTYTEKSGRQVLDGLPLVAYSATEPTMENGLTFKHVTAAITVRVKNTYEDTLDLTRIDLINDRYQLSGNVMVNLSQCAGDGTPTIAPRLKGRADTVSVVFVGTKKRIPQGQYVDIQIPILPVGGSNVNTDSNSIFRINVSARSKGGRYNYFRIQGLAANEAGVGNAKNNTIARAILGYATAKFDKDDTQHPVVVDDLFDKDTIGGKTYYEINSAEEFAALVEAMNNEY